VVPRLNKVLLKLAYSAELQEKPCKIEIYTTTPTNVARLALFSSGRKLAQSINSLSGLRPARREINYGPQTPIASRPDFLALDMVPSSSERKAMLHVGNLDIELTKDEIRTGGSTMSCLRQSKMFFAKRERPDKLL